MHMDQVDTVLIFMFVILLGFFFTVSCICCIGVNFLFFCRSYLAIVGIEDEIDLDCQWRESLNGVGG